MRALFPLLQGLFWTASNLGKQTSVALSAKNEIVPAVRFSLLLAEVFLAISSVQLERIQPVLTKLQNKVVLAMDNFLEFTFLFKLLFCLSFCLNF